MQQNYQTSKSNSIHLTRVQTKMLYWSLIRAKLDYIWSKRKFYQKELNTMHQQGLGAFNTFPIESLCTETHKMPLTLKRIVLQYYIKLSCPPNLIYNCFPFVI